MARLVITLQAGTDDLQVAIADDSHEVVGGAPAVPAAIVSNLARLAGQGGIVESVAADGKRWISVVRADRPTTALHALVDGSWHLDARRARMLDAMVRTAHELTTTPFDQTADRWSFERIAAERVLTALSLAARTYDDVVIGITAVVAPLLDCEKAGVAIWHEERRYLELLPGSHEGPDEIVASARVTASDVRTLTGPTVVSGRGRYSNDLVADLPRWREHFRSLGISQLLAVSLSAPGRTVGGLQLANHRTGFGPDDLDRAQAVVPAVTALVERVHDRQVMDARGELAAAVARIATAIASGQPLARLTSLLEAFCTAMRSDELIVSFHENVASGQSLHVVAAPVDPALSAAFRATSVRGSIALRTSMAPPRAAGEAGWSALHAPVRVSGELKATVSVLRTPYEPFVEDERDATMRLADLLALAYATERHRRERAEIVRMRERQRLADDLHDHVSQIFFTAHVTLESVIERSGLVDGTAPDVVRARDLLAHSQNAIRDVIDQLSDPGASSFAHRLAGVVESVEDEFAVFVNVDVHQQSVDQASQLPAPHADALLLAAREGLVNAARHAGPCQIWLSFGPLHGARVQVAVEDSGVGMPEGDVPSGQLVTLRRKLRSLGGVLSISASARGGVKLAASFPVTE